MVLVMSGVGDDVLWRRARDGDAEAFGALFDRHANTVYSYCFRRTADWALAEDLTSLVFLEAWRVRTRVAPAEANAVPLLLGIATNIVRNQWRSRRRHRAALQRIPAGDAERDFADELAERLDAERTMRSILDQVRQLPRAELDALALCAWSTLTTGEAALALGVPEATVRTRLHRARRRLHPGAADAFSDRPAEGATP